MHVHLYICTHTDKERNLWSWVTTFLGATLSVRTKPVLCFGNIYLTEFLIWKKLGSKLGSFGFSIIFSSIFLLIYCCYSFPYLSYYIKNNISMLNVHFKNKTYNPKHWRNSNQGPHVAPDSSVAAKTIPLLAHAAMACLKVHIFLCMYYNCKLYFF
jgi:hypothetical protein